MSDLLYTDSSALVKLVRTESESAALRRFLRREERAIASSRLAEIEVHRAARVAAEAELTSRARRVLARCDLAAVDDDVLDQARELVSEPLRTLDAIHLATALKLRSREFVTYDRRLMEAASAEGLRVLHPGLAG